MEIRRALFSDSRPQKSITGGEEIRRKNLETLLTSSPPVRVLSDGCRSNELLPSIRTGSR
jgi:hypothetical protein